jgi:hypothetical protein
VNRQRRIERGLHLLDCLQKLRQSFEREELTLQWHENRICCGHRVDRQQVERWRTVDQDVIEILSTRAAIELPQGIAQAEGAIALLTDFKLEARQVERRRGDVKLGHAGLQDGVAHRHRAGEHIVSRCAARFALDAQPGRGITLRVEIDDQYMLADRGECGPEIDGGRRFADPTFLIGDRKHSRASSIGFNGRFAERHNRWIDRRVGGWKVAHAPHSIVQRTVCLSL